MSANVALEMATPAKRHTISMYMLPFEGLCPSNDAPTQFATSSHTVMLSRLLTTSFYTVCHLPLLLAAAAP